MTSEGSASSVPGPIRLSEAELTALLNAAGSDDARLDADDPALAFLALRGLAKAEDGRLVIMRELGVTMEAVATCALNVLLEDSQGEPFDQYFFGQAASVTRVQQQEDAIGFQKLDADEAPDSIATSLTDHLASAASAELPDPSVLARAAQLVGVDELPAQGWCGLTLAYGATGPNGPELAPDFVLVALTNAGYVWHYPVRNQFALAQTIEDLAGLVASAILTLWSTSPPSAPAQDISAR